MFPLRGGDVRRTGLCEELRQRPPGDLERAVSGRTIVVAPRRGCKVLVLGVMWRPVVVAVGIISWEVIFIVGVRIAGWLHKLGRILPRPEFVSAIFCRAVQGDREFHSSNILTDVVVVSGEGWHELGAE